MNLKEICLYLVVAFGLAYVLDFSAYPMGLSLDDPVAMALVSLRMFTPFLGVLAVAVLRRERLVEFLRGHGLGIGGIRYVLLALAVPYLAYLLSVLYSLALGYGCVNPMTQIPEVSQAPVDPDTLLVIALLGGLLAGPTINALFAMGEEIGWRGYLLDTLKPRLGFTLSNVVIGVVWSLWHAPLILLFGYAFPHHRDALGIAVYTAALVVYSFILSTLRLESGKIYPPSVMHGTINALGNLMLLSTPVQDEVYAAPVGLLGILSFATSSLLVYAVVRAWRK